MFGGPKPARVRDDYPKLNALVYSLDVFLPVVKLYQGDYWQPSAGAGRKLPSARFPLPTFGGFLRLWLWLEILAGWTLTTLLVVGLSGLVRS